MGDWIYFNRLVPKSPSPMSFLKSWRFLIRQISKSVTHQRPCLRKLKLQDVQEPGKAVPKLNVWCALRKSRIIGPFFYTEATVNGECYRAMFRDSLFPELRLVNLVDRGLFQQGAASCHYASTVHPLWNDCFHTSGSVELDQYLGQLLLLFWPH